AAPQLVEQFKNTHDVSEAFGVLTSVLGQLSDRQDQLRLANAAGGEQMSKLAIEAARLGPAFEEARKGAQAANQVLSQEQIEALAKAKEAWTDFSNWVVLKTGGIIAAVEQYTERESQLFSRMQADAETLAQRLPTLGRESVDASVKVSGLTRSFEDL